MYSLLLRTKHGAGVEPVAWVLDYSWYGRRVHWSRARGANSVTGRAMGTGRAMAGQPSDTPAVTIELRG